MPPMWIDRCAVTGVPPCPMCLDLIAGYNDTNLTLSVMTGSLG